MEGLGIDYLVPDEGEDDEFFCGTFFFFSFSSIPHKQTHKLINSLDDRLGFLRSCGLSMDLNIIREFGIKD